MASNGVKSEKLNFRLPFLAHERLCLSSLKINFENGPPEQFSKTSVVIRFNLFQFCPSVPSFAFAVLFKPSFNV